MGLPEDVATLNSRLLDSNKVYLRTRLYGIAAAFFPVC